jgi:hypothetical protein
MSRSSTTGGNAETPADASVSLSSSEDAADESAMSRDLILAIVSWRRDPFNLDVFRIVVVGLCLLQNGIHFV